MEVSDATRLKVLEDENVKLNKLLTALVLDVSTLKDLPAKTVDARLTARCGDLGNGAERPIHWGERAGLSARNRRRSAVPASDRRCEDPAAAAGVGG